MWLGRREPGWFRQAPTIPALAQLVGLDPDALAATVARFNRFVRDGTDADFGRGETAWERLTMPSQGGNPHLGAIEQPPFHAAPCHRVILGTKGGPRTNAHGQALRADGSVVAGLYCAGLAMANPIGTKAVSAGTTLGPCLTWGYICGLALGREGQIHVERGSIGDHHGVVASFAAGVLGRVLAWHRLGHAQARRGGVPVPPRPT